MTSASFHCLKFSSDVTDYAAFACACGGHAFVHVSLTLTAMWVQKYGRRNDVREDTDFTIGEFTQTRLRCNMWLGFGHLGIFVFEKLDRIYLSFHFFKNFKFSKRVKKRENRGQLFWSFPVISARKCDHKTTCTVTETAMHIMCFTAERTLATVLGKASSP